MKNKKNKPTASSSVKVFIESLFINEQTPILTPQSTQEFGPVVIKPISLDQAVDKYFIQYERESIPTSKIYESIDHLLEQIEDDNADETDPTDTGEQQDAGDPAAAGTAEDTPSDGAVDTEPGSNGDSVLSGNQFSPVMATPKINLNDFARSVARLTNNFQALLDPKTLILNRAEAFIKSNYDEKTSKELMEILEVNYGLQPNEVGNSNEMPEYPTPYTVGANGSGNG